MLVGTKKLPEAYHAKKPAHDRLLRWKIDKWMLPEIVIPANYPQILNKRVSVSQSWINGYTPILRNHLNILYETSKRCRKVFPGCVFNELNTPHHGGRGGNRMGVFNMNR
jgi:hypothetical protein